MKTEAELMKQISKRLWIYRLTGEVVWHHRIQSGKVKVGAYYINLADKGTPDWFALIRGRNNELLGLFIEAKSDKGVLRPAQVDFISKINGKRNVYILVLKDIKDFDIWISKYAKNFVNELPKEL